MRSSRQLRVAAAAALLASALFAGPMLAPPSAAAEADDADIVVFWGEGCPTSAEAMDWLDDYAASHPDVEVARVEVWDDPDGADRFAEVMAGLDREPRRVPTFVVDGQVRVGFSPTVADWVTTTAAGEADGGDEPALPPPGESPDADALADAGERAFESDGVSAEGRPHVLVAIAVLVAVAIAAGGGARGLRRGRTDGPGGDPPSDGETPHGRG